MKIISEKIVSMLKLFTPQSGFVIFLLGLLGLLAPDFYLWGFIVIPSLSIPLMFLALILYSVQKFFVFLAMLQTLSTFILNTSARAKIVSVCLLAILMSTTFIMNPDRNFVESDLGILLGAKTRLSWGGGPENVKADALALLTQELDEDGYITSELQSDSLKRIGAGVTKVDKELQSVAVFVPVGNILYDFDDFGYLFTNNEKPDFNFLKIARGTTIEYWEIADGIYFFDRNW